jgi:hypothetical protein
VEGQIISPHRCPANASVSGRSSFQNPATKTPFLGQNKAMGIDDERYTTWNAELLGQAKDFATDASKASIFVVSSYAIISDILDDPEINGLSDCIEEENLNSENEDGDEELDDLIPHPHPRDSDNQRAM